jgi:hypothetical protein
MSSDIKNAAQDIQLLEGDSQLGGVRNLRRLRFGPDRKEKRQPEERTNELL